MSRVLIVDDDPSLRAMLRLIFELAGYEVTEAAHGDDALSIVRGAQLPDVVLTDLMMPVMDGNELIRRLRSEPKTAAIPIVVVSANAEASEGVEASAQADFLVMKPFVPAQLVEAVRALGVGAPPRGT